MSPKPPLLPQNRIIDDALYAAAQARKAQMPGAGGRRRSTPPAGPRHPFSCFLHCPKHRALHAADVSFWCRRCYYDKREMGAEPVLYSRVRRDIALVAICQPVAKAI